MDFIFSGGGNVIAGDYNGWIIWVLDDGLPYLVRDTNDTRGAMVLDSRSVSSWGVQDEDSRRSATSAVGRAAIGAALLGPVGLAAGLSAKKKGVYTIVINFTNGRRCLARVNEKGYRAILNANY